MVKSLCFRPMFVVIPVNQTAVYITVETASGMIGKLPPHLAERVRHLNDVQQPNGDGPVVVWLKSSFRVHENPAIDVGATLAQAYGLPLLIYQGIDERYPHASLRHHNMLLEAAVDMDEHCRRNNLRYVLHLARKGHRQPVLKVLSQTASCIVTDMFPLPPWTTWVETIASRAKGPMFDVDCHCVVPMPLFGKSVDRPYKYRDSTKRLRKKRLQATWPKMEYLAESYTGELPFEPVDILAHLVDPLRRIALLQECEIDPTVLPVWGVRGGENAALQKWQKFFDNGLNGYARRRNNAADSTGVSRLSYAFHYGFLSPMRVAREAAAVGTKSAEKYLDELLVFREHAWHHIYAMQDPYAASNLPEWALQSWRDTSDDPRPTLLSEHQFEFAQSPHALWNLCQQSLLRHGELHNNLRMTWGKAFPLWTPNLQASLELSQHFNDKYALDGRDPSSVVGVQWCHGLFDRAFFPSERVMGVVRKRDIVTHSSRLDTEKYAKHINRLPSVKQDVYLLASEDTLSVFIARVLVDNGYEVFSIGNGEAPAAPWLNQETGAEQLPNWFTSRIPEGSPINDEKLWAAAGIQTLHVSTLEAETMKSGKPISLQVDGSQRTIAGLLQSENNTLQILSSAVSLEDDEPNQGDSSLTQCIENAAWKLAHYMFAMHAQPSSKGYAVQTRLF